MSENSHHHQHNDETGEFRRQMERSVRMRKVLPKILFRVTCLVALLVIIAAVALVMLD